MRNAQGVMLVAWAVSVPLAAEDLMDMSLDRLLQIPITTASRYQQTSLETPATVKVITEQQIRQRRYTNLIDLLEDLPAIDVQRRVDPSRQNWLTVNGLGGSNRMLIFRDGVRVDSPSGDVIAVDQNFPLFAAKRVEILYGPAAAVYGADAFGGVINIITREPSPEAELDVRAELRAGSGDMRYADLFIGHAWASGVELSLGGHRHQDRLAETSKDKALFAATDALNFSNQVLVPAAAREDHQSPIESDSLFARLRYQDRFELGLQQWQFQQQTSQAFRRQEALSLDQDISLTSVQSLYGRAQWAWAPDLDNRLLLDRGQFLIEPETRFDNIFSGFKPAYKYARSTKHSLEDQLDFRWTEQHRLTGGLGKEWFDVIPRSPDLPQPYQTDRGPDEQGLNYPNTSLPIQLYRLRYDNQFVYGQWQADWTSQWSSTLGLRQDDNSNYGRSLNPRLGLVYQATADQTWKLLYAKAFRAPSISGENYVTFGSFSGQTNAQGQYLGTGFRVPNPDLKPERLQGVELALLQRLNSDWEFNARAYRYRVQDLIQPRAEPNPEQFIEGAWLSQASILDNVDSSQNFGLDLGLETRQWLQQGWALNAWSYYSYQDGNLERRAATLQDLPHIARHKLKFGSTFEWQQRYFVTLKGHLQSRTNSNMTDPQKPGSLLQAPGYGILDLHLGRQAQPGKPWSINLDIYNLLNRNYYHAVFDNSAGRGGAIIAQPERAWMLSLGYGWY